jgi:hypothetical protein
VPKPGFIVAYAITANQNKQNIVSLNVINFSSHGNTHSSSVITLDSIGGIADENSVKLLGFSGMPLDRFELTPAFLLVLNDLKINQRPDLPRDLYSIVKLGSN